MMSTSVVSSNMNNMSVLNGSNFKDCKDYILIALGCMDLDYALRIEQPTSHTDYSASYQRRNYEKWEYSNRVSLLIIRCSSLEAF